MNQKCVLKKVYMSKRCGGKNMGDNNTNTNNQNDKKKGWASIINAVQQPLGFFTLAALIVNGILGTTVITEIVPWWAPALILVLIIVLVFIAMMIKPEVLTGEQPILYTIPIIFSSNGQRIASDQVELDEERCQITIHSKEGRQKYKGRVRLTYPNGQCSFHVPKGAKLSDDVRLWLIETNNQEWRVKPRPLNEFDVEAVRIIKKTGGGL